MTNYTQNTTFTTKDALTTGDANKLVTGAGLDGEFSEIQTTIATKYDISNLATQVQAEAGSNNDAWMSPLRVAQYLGGAGGASGAGMVGDIVALADPNADRILFWDDSANDLAGAAAFLTASTGLTITGTNITTNDAQIVLTALSGYVADQHVAHAGVSITAGTGLTGGGTIAATRTLSLDIFGLTTDNIIDTAADYVPYYNAGDGGTNKVLMSTLVGSAVGDQKAYLSGAQALAAGVEATVIYNINDYSGLQRGTYSTSTGIYTAGSSGARVLVTAYCTVTSVAPGVSYSLTIAKNGANDARSIHRNDANATAEEGCLTISAAYTLAASGTIQVRAYCSAAGSLTTGLLYNAVSFVELG